MNVLFLLRKRYYHVILLSTDIAQYKDVNYHVIYNHQYLGVYLVKYVNLKSGIGITNCSIGFLHLDINSSYQRHQTKHISHIKHQKLSKEQSLTWPYHKNKMSNTNIPLVAYMIADVGLSKIASVRCSIASSKLPAKFLNQTSQTLLHQTQKGILQSTPVF